jgi:hypothetical protein
MDAQAFRAQFETRVTLSPELLEILQLERETFGYKVYRLLDRLVLEEKGQFYVHARPEDSPCGQDGEEK